jgi:predicted ferric reductase
MEVNMNQPDNATGQRPPGTIKREIDSYDDLPAMPFQTFMLFLVSAAVGAIAAVLILPDWLPGLSASFSGSAPQAFWFLSRSSAAVAYTLLWLSMAFGLLITNKMARLWPGGPFAFELHQYTSLLGLAFALFHGLILMGDHYIHFSLSRVLVPFSNPEYRPVWVGLGQIAFYLMGVVALSFYVRRQIGRRLWRLIHYLSFATYLLALWHGVFSGTDSSAAWARGLYWASGGLFLFLVTYRLLTSLAKPRSRALNKPV